MVSTKNNRRTLYTKNQLKQALLKLLATTPLADITVTRLCQTADVNRGTFYAHYQSPTELFHSLEAELVAQITPLLGDGSKDLTAWLPDVLRVIQQNEPATLIIIRNLQESALLQSVLTPIRARMLAAYALWFGENDPALLDYYFDFFLSGAIRVITAWLQSGAKESPEAIARVIQNVTGR